MVSRHFRLALLVCVFFAVSPRAPGQTSSNEIQALKLLIEEQNKNIAALQEKVRILEQRDAERSATNLHPTLPAIVIDTNGAPVAPASGTNPTEKLEAKIRDLEHREDAAEADAVEQAKRMPRISAGADGFAFASANTNFSFRVKGIFQADTRTFIHDNQFNNGNDGFVIRRARPIFEGTVFRDFDYLIMPDFAGASPQLFEMWINYRYRPELQLRVGKLSGPDGSENLVLDSQLLLNERSFVDGLLPSRSVGVELWGDVFDARLDLCRRRFQWRRRWTSARQQ